MRCNNCFEEYNHDSEEKCPFCGYAPGDKPSDLRYLQPGTTLHERYIVGKALGDGGFGIIYKSWDSAAGCLVAVKEFYPAGLVGRDIGTANIRLFARGRAAEYSENRERFILEAANVERFGAEGIPNIVRVFEHFEENGTVYMSMEYLSGSLENRLKQLEDQNQMLPWAEAVNIISKVALALYALHQHGVIHRDVGPDNIMLGEDGSVKLIDFGAARFFPDEKETLVSRIMKPGYSPPEQYENAGSMGPWTDVYALGATLYRAVTGLTPEESTNRETEDTLATPLALVEGTANSSLPPHISDVILKAMALELRYRFRSVEDFIRALRGEEKILTPQAEKRKRRRKRARVIAAACAVIVVGLSASLLTLNRQKEAETLPDASISLWYELSGDADADAAKAEALNLILTEFVESFPNVTVEPRGIESASYADEIDAALNAGSPVLFESTSILPERLNAARELDGIAENVRENCYFLDKYTRWFPDKKQIPLGFSAPVVYVNSTITTPGEDVYGVGDLSALIADMPAASSGIALADGAESAFAESYGTNVSYAAAEAFYGEEVGAYFAYTSDFFAVRAALPARYRVLSVDRPNVIGRFSYLWSLAPCEKDEAAAATRLLEFMFSNNAQDYLHVRAQSGSLPINRSVLTVYSEVYNDFEHFFTNIEEYTYEIR
ncbi:MAG: extracellular solute-binding protein [Oscillospiraceae bacterium]|jgi:serine/threonine protein kinase|nr:extracellular solute-binding protein [Oscillospiraceae bacterium]